MWIYEALLGVEVLERTRSAIDVTGVQYDSRRVRPGDVFVAMAGGTTDGNRFIEAALAKGGGRHRYGFARDVGAAECAGGWW